MTGRLALTVCKPSSLCAPVLTYLSTLRSGARELTVLAFAELRFAASCQGLALASPSRFTTAQNLIPTMLQEYPA